jgi:hypothetical protein
VVDAVNTCMLRPTLCIHRLPTLPQVTAVVMGDESANLVPPRGYHGECTIAYRSTKVSSWCTSACCSCRAFSSWWAACIQGKVVAVGCLRRSASALLALQMACQCVQTYSQLIMSVVPHNPPGVPGARHSACHYASQDQDSVHAGPLLLERGGYWRAAGCWAQCGAL